ncbi:hypothetical protein ACJX0J_033561, partial [Zea mays]
PDRLFGMTGGSFQYQTIFIFGSTKNSLVYLFWSPVFFLNLWAFSKRLTIGEQLLLSIEKKEPKDACLILGVLSHTFYRKEIIVLKMALCVLGVFLQRILIPEQKYLPEVSISTTISTDGDLATAATLLHIHLE